MVVDSHYRLVAQKLLLDKMFLTRELLTDILLLAHSRFKPM